MSDWKRHLLSIPLLAPLLQWGWGILTINRFKREHHAQMLHLQHENAALSHRCDELTRRVEHFESVMQSTVETEVARQLHYQSLALQQQVDQLGFDLRIASSVRSAES